MHFVQGALSFETLSGKNTTVKIFVHSFRSTLDFDSGNLGSTNHTQQWCTPAQNFGTGQQGLFFDFQRETVFGLGHRLSKHKTARYARNLRRHDPLDRNGYGYDTLLKFRKVTHMTSQGWFCGVMKCQSLQMEFSKQCHFWIKTKNESPAISDLATHKPQPFAQRIYVKRHSQN